MRDESNENRPMTDEERRLIRWMLEHGTPDAMEFLPQLALACVTPSRCPCGCASIDLAIDGHPLPTGGFRVLADFEFGNDRDLSGIFVWEQNRILAGLEVYGMAGDAPKSLPACEDLR